MLYRSHGVAVAETVSADIAGPDLLPLIQQWVIPGQRVDKVAEEAALVRAAGQTALTYHNDIPVRLFHS